MARLAQIEESELSAEAVTVWDEIKSTRGFVRGPFKILLHLPALAQRIASIGEYIRYQGQLPGADRELAILVCGKEAGARYEWFEHESKARSEGVRAEVIEALRSDSKLDGLTERESLIVSSVQTLCRQKNLSESQYEKAVQVLGEKNLLEMTALVGYYTLLAMVINTYNVDPPADAPPTF